MTVSNTTSRNQYTATSGQTVFPYTFEIFDKDDVAVLKNGTLLSEGTDYTVSGVGNDSGGNITLTVGATAGDILTIYRDMAYQRLTDYQNSGDFLAQEVNDDFDRLWLAIQQQNADSSRAVVKPITDSASIDMTLPSSADRANSFLTFDATGAPSVTRAGDPAAPSSIVRQQFTGDGATLVYTLASAPGALGQSMQVFIDGVYQENDTYSVSGTSLTFSEAPPLNASIETVAFEVNAIGETSSNLVSYTPAGSGAVQTTVQSKLRETVSVKDFGAVGDGVTDDTLAVYRAILQGGYILFPKGTYRVVYATMNSMPESDTRARIPFVSGTTVEFEQGASITMLDNTGSDIYAVFEIISVSDITLINPTIIADADANVLTTEGAGHAIDARSVTNLKIFGGNLSKAFTDGLYINNCTNVEVVGLTCDSNGRQGCSVISGSNISIRDCTFSNSNRVAPMAGIDIEPNPTDTLLKNVYLDNIRTEGNNGAGLNVNLTGTNLEASVVINNHTDHGSAYGASFGKFNNSSTFTDGSFIRYSNGRSFNAVNCGIQMIWTDSNVLLTVDNPYVYNPNTSLGTNQRSQDVGISLHNEVTGYTGGTDLGNVELINPKIELASGRTLTRGIYIGFDETINNIKVIDPIKVDIGSPSTVSTNNIRVLMQLKNAGTNVSFSDRYRALKMINSASTLVRNYNTGSFSVIENTYTAAPYTLNEYSNFLVAEDLTILKDSSANTITVNLPGTASFVNAAGTAVSTSATTTTPNAVLKFYRLKTGLYKVVGETGTWTIT